MFKTSPLRLQKLSELSQKAEPGDNSGIKNISAFSTNKACKIIKIDINNLCAEEPKEIKHDTREQNEVNDSTLHSTDQKDFILPCHTQKKVKKLALRADVMNKNFFRAFRRE